MEKEYDPNYIAEKVYFQVGQKAIIWNSDKKILLLKRSGIAGGKWSFPGGGLEKGEGAIESIKREIKEETNLDCSDFKVYYIHTSNSNSDESGIIIGYECQFSGEVKLNWEHGEYRWIFPKDALEFELTPHARILLEYHVKARP
ncbi:MAG: Hydrolase, NUDIX family [Candidatus Nomurabacteria bacterium GW2011_GWB1_37_5]|uniref:Hydrolase, NUDIX family n=1 Tax=Candidatus Nomurabacteria bacterium GW2011_GWB1_37_5 TaxID=1618742 RepID=A0A0G0GWU1_9BACT|nr:MAG: Hydrolase, NUDIX family [Candidatus Nomurabacteria bacterium GW2011_GWB1_37_5]